jgi:hypothetical protein
MIGFAAPFFIYLWFFCHRPNYTDFIEYHLKQSRRKNRRCLLQKNPPIVCEETIVKLPHIKCSIDLWGYPEYFHMKARKREEK